MTHRILIVDDDVALGELLADQLSERMDVDVSFVVDGARAVEHMRGADVDVVVTDLRMPGMLGTQLCQELAEAHPAVPVIVMTGFGSMDAAVAAIRAGAYDFLTKPFEPERLVLAIERALSHDALRREVRRLKRNAGEGAGYGAMVGTSPPMQRLYDLVERVGHSEASILVQGESGTGKELVARALHAASRRAEGPFVALNCAAMPEALLESELFGHERGAFTDAKTARLGLLREAAGGTLFLDEIGDLAPTLQPKLLRALQEHAVRPVGGGQEVAIDVRIVAASHRPLDEAVKAGDFRADLYYRLNVITVEVPPLRERGDDVLLLAQAFLDEIAAREGTSPPSLPDAMAPAFLAYDWPGNVRELHNCMERCVALASGGPIELAHLPESLYHLVPSIPPPADAASAARNTTSFAPLADVERWHILRTYDALGRNKSRTARALGIDRKTLHARLARYGEDG